MPEISKQTSDHAERLVAIQLLSHPRGRERESLYKALHHVERDAIDDAIASLEQAGVLLIAGRLLRPSAAFSCLERLDLIGI